jgi:hypothetical protein
MAEELTRAIVEHVVDSAAARDEIALLVLKTMV